MLKPHQTQSTKTGNTTRFFFNEGYDTIELLRIGEDRYRFSLKSHGYTICEEPESGYIGGIYMIGYYKRRQAQARAFTKAKQLGWIPRPKS